MKIILKTKQKFILYLIESIFIYDIWIWLSQFLFIIEKWVEMMNELKINVYNINIIYNIILIF